MTVAGYCRLLTFKPIPIGDFQPGEIGKVPRCCAGKSGFPIDGLGFSLPTSRSDNAGFGGPFMGLENPAL
jgi:hypothetical protein